MHLEARGGCWEFDSCPVSFIILRENLLLNLARLAANKP